jgi:Cu/Ag efflux protein CusF
MRCVLNSAQSHSGPDRSGLPDEAKGEVRMIRYAVFAGSLALAPLGLVSCAPASPVSQEEIADPDALGAALGPRVAPAFGSILSLDSANRTIEITHTPVNETGWPIMQMNFSVAHHVDVSGFAPGDPVEFIFDYSNEDVPEIVAIRRVSAREVIEALVPDDEESSGNEPN